VIFYNTETSRLFFFKEIFKYVEESISLSLSLSLLLYGFLNIPARETGISKLHWFYVSPLSVSCFQPRLKRKYRALSLARLATKLQRTHYTEVKHYLWITAPLSYRILPLPSCAVQILRGVPKTRAIRIGLWENNSSRLLEDSRELTESLTRLLLCWFSSSLYKSNLSEYATIVKVESVRLEWVSNLGSMRAACSFTLCHVTLHVTKKAPIQSWLIEFHPGFSVLFPVFDLYCGVRFRVTLHLVWSDTVIRH